MPKVLHVRDAGKKNTETQTYVGRPSKWGNPFVIEVDGDRREVIWKFEKYLLASPLMNDLDELRGKDLVCFCAPEQCHADSLLFFANLDWEQENHEG